MKDSRQIHGPVGCLWKKNLKSPPGFMIFHCVILMFNFDPTLESFLWVIAIGLTIVIVDVFFETEILSAGALLGISIYFSLLFDVDWKWRVLNALVCWLVVTALFYAVWKRFVTPLIRRGFTSGIKESIHSAVGAVGEFRLIDGKAFVYWNGRSRWRPCAICRRRWAVQRPRQGNDSVFRKRHFFTITDHRTQCH
jgi:hypothetical protein